MPDFSNLIRIAKVQIFLALFLVTIFAIIFNFSFLIILRYLAILGFTLVLEYLLWKIRGITPFIPSASFVTATIIFLLSEPSTTVVFPLIAVIFAVLQKQFIRFWGSHFVNPAAFGLFASGYLGNIISWWGPNLGQVVLLITLFATGYVSQIRVKQWPITLPFLLTSLIILFFRSGDFAAAISQVTVGAFLFFALVMLPEPATAAQGKWTKPLFGVAVAILPFILINIPFISDLELASLLIGNLIFKIIDRYLQTRNQPAPQKSLT